MNMETATLMLTDEQINMFSGYFINFLFILLRASIFVSLMPVLGDRQVPPQFKIGFAVFIAIIMTPVVHFEIKGNNIPMIILQELMIGIVMALSVRFVFLAVNMGGQFVSHIMGMSIARVFNPEYGSSTQVAEAFGIIAMLVFLTVDAHHDLIYAFVKSYEILPAGKMNIMGLVPQVLALGTKFFILAMKVAAPVVVGLLISHILSGFLYKAAPQMNIFFITMPLNIFLGILLIVLSLPIYEYILNVNISNLRSDMMRMLSIAKG